MKVDHYVSLHLTATQVEVIPAMQGDGARYLLASLMANGEPWVIPEGANVGIAYTLPDKTDGYYNQLTDGSPAADVAGNLVSVMLTPVLTRQAGTVKLSLVLRQGEKQIATFPLQLKVQGAVGKVLGEDVPVQVDGFEGRLYYGGPGGTIIPLALGPGLVVRDGVLVLQVATGGEGVEKPGGGADLTSVQTILRNVMTILRLQVEDETGTPQAYSTDISGLAAECDALIAGLTGSGGEAPEGPEQPDKILTSISAVYSGGSVPVGTAVSALTGVVVTAHYSDGSTAVVTGYTLSGTIAEGSNTITVSYGGMTATITVVGVAEESGLEQYEYTIAGGGNLNNSGGILANNLYQYTDYIQLDPDYAAVTLAAYLAAPADAPTNVNSYIQWFSGDVFISRTAAMVEMAVEQTVGVSNNAVPDGATKFRISVQNNCERFELYKGEVSAEEVA